MSDYARNYNFTAKDALTTGDPNKLIKGSEVDDEFNDVLTAVNSKIDEPASPSADDILQYVSGAWSAVANALVPTATVVATARSTAPTGWLLCDGSDVSQTTYAALYTAIGVTYGDPGGGNFTLPDLRGRAVFGKDDMGGTAANRVTSGAAPAIDGTTLGDTGGVEEHALTEAELGSHDHNLKSGGGIVRYLFGAGSEGFGAGGPAVMIFRFSKGPFLMIFSLEAPDRNVVRPFSLFI